MLFTSSKHKEALTLILGIFLIAGIALLIFTAPTKSEPLVSTPPAGALIMRGTMVCLPHRNTSGPQTLECALGLQDADGLFYALRDTDPQYQNISGVPTDVPVIVTGTFMPKEDTKYKSIGTIDVTDISIADVPQRASLSGVYICLPHIDTTGPQTDECANGIQTEDGTYYAIDFGLMSQSMPQLSMGDSIRASGVLVPIEQISNDRWRIYPIKGIFSVTNSLEKL